MSKSMSPARTRGWTLAIVSIGLFMTVLDNLVVSVALPSIRRSLAASVQTLEWTVNAYTLAYAVLLLTGAALGDRLGRRRVFVAGMALFTCASAASALAPTGPALIAARAAQGIGAAIATPLTLTLLAEAFPPQRRGLALGIWSAVSGVAVAVGPLVGGAAIRLGGWHWIFWINVPIGAALVVLARARLRESHGAARTLDLPGLALGSAGLLGVVYGLVRSQTAGFGDGEVIAALGIGAALIAAFIAAERRSPEPMLPLGFFADRTFTLTNLALLSMYFGMFGSVFFLSQFLQNVLGNTPLQAGVKLLVWTGAIMVVSPAAGVLSDRWGSRLFMAAGLGAQALALGWLALLAGVHESYASMIGPFLLGGSGMGLVFAPSSSAVLSSVRPEQAGQASGATNAIRELGGVLGVSVLASVFTADGGYGSAHRFIAGMVPAVWVGAAVLAAGSLVLLAVRFRPARSAAPAPEPIAPDGSGLAWSAGIDSASAGGLDPAPIRGIDPAAPGGIAATVT
ncbi:MAG TPA: MFS transporter [Solirubrobacteraceae bacterium]|nr:MFS transporter [Solirubrobacteraceae bacterium]